MRKKLQTVLAILKKNWLWIGFILIALAGCIINIIYSYNIDNHTNFFTAIGGWVSGIATLILGVITLWQSQKYTLATIKLEVKEQIYEEQYKINEAFDFIAKYNYLNEPLYMIASKNAAQRNLYAYEMKIVDIRERLLILTHKIQLLKFSHDKMVPLCNSITDLIKYTFADYQAIKEHYLNDNLLRKDIDKILSYTSNWKINFMSLCQKAMKNLMDLSCKIEEFKSINELNNYLQDIEKKIANARMEVSKSLKEQNNEQTQNAIDG